MRSFRYGVFAILSVILSLYVGSLMGWTKEMFFGVSDFIIGYPVVIAYPKTYDLVYAFTLIFSTVFFFLCMDKIYSYVGKIVSFSIAYEIKNEKVFNSLRSIDYSHIFKVLKYPFLCFIIFGGSIYGLILIFPRVFLKPISPELFQAIYIIYAFAFLVTIVSMVRRYKKINIQKLEKICFYILFTCQIFFVLFLSLFLPVPAQDKVGNVFQYIAFKKSYYVFLLLLGSAGIADLLYRFWQVKYRNKDMVEIFSPLLISFFLLIFMRYIPFSINQLSVDDYHWGEYLLPYFLWIEYGLAAYVDYIPAHGFINLIPGFLADMFIQGGVTYQNITYMRPVMLMLDAIIVFLLFKYAFNYYVAILWILFIFIFSSSASVFAIMILLSPKLIQRPFLWLLSFSVIGLMCTLYLVGVGSVGVLALMPLFVYVLYQFIKDKAYKEKINIIVSIIYLVVLAWLLTQTLLLDICLGVVNILKENGSINLYAYGLPLDKFKLRSSWIFMTSGLILLIIYLMRKKKKDLPVIITMMVMCLFVFLLSPYSLGRILPNGWSRTGAVTVYFLCLFIPILLSIMPTKAITKIIYLCAMIIFVYQRPYYQPLQHHKIQTYGEESFVDGNEIGLPRVGKVYANAQHINRHVALQKVLNKYLDDDDSYLDMTNRNAQYFYMQRKLPIESGAFYNLAHPEQGRRSVERLEAAPPKVILVGSGLYHDGLRLSMRTYELYRWIVLADYTAIQEGEFTLLIRNDIHQQEISEADHLDLVKANLGEHDMKKTPISWGYSYDKLIKKMTLRSEIKVQPKRIHDMVMIEEGKWNLGERDPYLVFDIQDKNIKGREASLLVVDIQCEGLEQFGAELFFESDKRPNFNEKNKYSFVLKTGKNIIPVDIDPYWLLSDKIKAIRLDVNDKRCRILKLNELGLYERKR